MSALRKSFLIILALAICATVAFIFYNSTLPPEESSEQSGAFGDIIAEIIPPETEAGSFVQTYLRKIAHFTEYGLLGIELTLFCMLLKKKRLRLLLNAFIFSVFVALSDETIQIFSKRGPSVNDIWIDVGGYVFFSALTLVLLFALSLILPKAREPRYILIKKRNAQEIE